MHFEHLFGHYKRSKYLAEHEVLRAGATGLPVVLVHPTFPVGERDTAPTPTGRTIVEFLNGRIPAYVDTALNVAHVDDVARGHVLAAQRGALGRSYILGGENMSLQQMLATLADVCGLPAPRVRLSPHVVLPDRSRRGVVPGEACCGASRRCRRSRCAWRPPAWNTTPAGPAPSSATRACPHATRCARAARWFVDNGHVKAAQVEKIRRAGRLADSTRAVAIDADDRQGDVRPSR